MKNQIITEEQVKSTLISILNEESSKVKREEFNRVQFKMDELENSINDSIKELDKLKNSIPEGLKTITNGRISGVTSNLIGAKKLIGALKVKVKTHKKSLYSQQVDETKKKS